MFHYFNVCQNTKGDALAGWYIEALDADGNVASLYADENGTAINQVSGYNDRARTDELGNYDFWVEDGTYSLKFYNAAGVSQRTQDGVQMYSPAASAANTKILDGYTITHVSGTETNGITFTGTSTGASGTVRLTTQAFTYTTRIKTINWVPRIPGSGATAYFYSPNGDGTYKFEYSISLGTVTSAQLNTVVSVDVSAFNQSVAAGWRVGHYTAVNGQITTQNAPTQIFTGSPTGTAITFVTANQTPALQVIGDYSEDLGVGAVKNDLTTLQNRATALETAEPPNAIYNLVRSNTRKLLAGIANVMSGTADMEILFISDSIFAASGAGTGGVSGYNNARDRSVPALFAKWLAAQGVNVTYESVFGATNTQVTYPAYNPRVQHGTNWLYGGQGFAGSSGIADPAYTTLGGGFFVSPTGTATSALTYTPTTPVDRFKIGYAVASWAGVLQYQVDGGSWTDVPQNGTAAYAEVTINAGTPAIHTLGLRRKDETGAANFCELDAWDSTRKSVRIHNAAHAGAVAAGTLMTAISPWSPLNRIAARYADVTHLNAGANDVRLGFSTTDYQTAIELIMTNRKALGSDFIMHAIPPQDPAQPGSTATEDQQAAFVACAKQAAVRKGAVCVDQRAGLGTYAIASAAGQTADYIHYNYIGQNALLALMTPAYADAVTQPAVAYQPPSYSPGALKSGVWKPYTGLPRLRFNGTGSITIDANTAADGSGSTTTAVYSNSLTSASNLIDFPYFGDNAVAVRATLTGTLAAEII